MPVPAGSNEITDPAEIVRLLIPDRGAQPQFKNEEIAAFLALEGDNVRLAAAQALDTAASRLMMTSRVTSALDMSTDGVRVSDLLKRAQSLREQAAQFDADGDADQFSIDIVDFDPSRWF